MKPLDDDDWLAPNCLEVMTNALTKARLAGLNPVLVSVNAINVDIDGIELGRSGASPRRLSA